MTIKLLAIDTATDACSVALMLDTEIHECFQVAPQQHTHLLLPMIEKLLAKHRVPLAELTALAFGQGPGSFTGIRIATGVVQGLAFAANLPVIPISSLQALAQTAYETTQSERLLTVVDARMNEVYWAYYELGEGKLMKLVGSEQIGAPTSICFPQVADWRGVGSGWDSYQTVIAQLPHYQHERILPACYPRASAIVKLAKDCYLHGKSVPVDQALPNYLRETVAWKKPAK